MGATERHFANLQPVGEQRQQGDRSVTLREPEQVRLSKAGGVAKLHLLEGEAEARPEAPADIPFHHQLAARALAHLLRQLGLELIGVNQRHQGGDGHHGRQRQPQQYVDDLLHDELLNADPVADYTTGGAAQAVQAPKRTNGETGMVAPACPTTEKGPAGPWSHWMVGSCR
ncbi:hypothetical protein D3C87_1274440 [compost metagenome]